MNRENGDIHSLAEYEVQMTARVTTTEFGADAVPFAQMRVNEMVELDEHDGAYAWRRVFKAIQDIQQRDPKLS